MVYPALGTTPSHTGLRIARFTIVIPLGAFNRHITDILLVGERCFAVMRYSIELSGKRTVKQVLNHEGNKYIGEGGP